MKHNVYDFDETIYQGDSTFDFYRFCLKRNPWILTELVIFIPYSILFMIGLKSQTEMKEKFYRFLRHLNSVDDLLEEFWNTHRSNIKAFYLEGQKENDIVISASPEFLLIPVCKSLNIKYLMASRVDKHTGAYTGENCKGKEKVRRLRELMPDALIGDFYSDSLSDAPLAELADRSFLVKDNKIIPWSEYRPSALERIRYFS